MSNNKILIIVEGGTDQDIIKKIISENNLFDSTKVHFEPKNRGKGGINSVYEYIENLSVESIVTKMELDKILIIIDSDEENPSDRFIKITRRLKKQEKELKKYKINKIPEKPGLIYRLGNNVGIGVFLVPNNEDKGSIETLCLKALKNKKLDNKKLGKFFDCIENYIKCVKIGKILKENITENQVDKRKFRIFIHTIEPDCYNPTIDKEVDYKNSVFDVLKEFING
jgi:hypothetical protein